MTFKRCELSFAQCFFGKEILIHYRWKVTFDAVTSLMCTIYVFFLCPAKQTIPSSEYGTTTAILQFHCRNNSSQGSSCNMKAETAVMLTYFSFYMNHFFLNGLFALVLNSERNEMIFCCSAAEKKEDHSISAGILLPQHLLAFLVASEATTTAKHLKTDCSQLFSVP